MVVVAYRRWLFTRGSNFKALAGKLLVFWIGGRLWEAVAHGGSTVFYYYWGKENHLLYQGLCYIELRYIKVQL